MERMTKKYFLDLVIAKCDREVSDRFASMFIDVITDVLKNAMKDNTVVSIPPLGVFKPVFKPPRESYIPSTGEKLLLPAKREAASAGQNCCEVPAVKAVQTLREYA